MTDNNTRTFPRSLSDAFPQDRASCTEGWQRPNADLPVVWAGLICLLILAICYWVQA